MKREVQMKALSLALLGTLSIASPVFAGPSHRVTHSNIATIFTPDMLQAQIAYFEHIVGPAWRVDGHDRVYKVSGCIVSVIEKENAVQALKLNLNEHCTFNLKPFLQSNLPTAKDLTFGAFDKEFGGKFYADCLTSCGNAADPVVSEQYEGPHALNWINVELDVALVDMKAIDASIAWEKVIEAAHGEDYVMEGKFNCNTEFDETAHRAFKEVKLTAITIGYDLFPPTRCSQ